MNPSNEPRTSHAEPDTRALTAESVRYLQDLLRFDTTNPPGNEAPAVQYLAQVLQREGYPVEVIESAPGRANLVTRYRGSGEREPLLLYGHVDVVAADPSRWTHEPFSGDLAEGCIWGRGALDMKGLVAQELVVMLLLQRCRLRLKRDVIFAATADEEVGGAAGMGFLTDHYPDLIRAGYALSEGGGTTMYIAGKPFYDVRVAEKGTCRFALRSRGHPGHGSVPRRDTAVTKIAEAVLKLSTTPLPFRSTATFVAFFRLIAEALGLPPQARVLNEPNLQRALQLVPPDMGNYLRALTRDTAVPTVLRAGEKINVVPGAAEALIDGRYLPGQTAEGFLEEVRQVIGPGYEIERIDTTRPLEDPLGGPLYETIVSVMSRFAPGATVAPLMLAGATDAKHMARLGTKCLGFGPVRIAEGFPLEHQIHGYDERIPVEGYVWGIRVLYSIVRDFCS